jgi:magnesium transporter
VATRSQPPVTKARLFDADRSDQEIELTAKTVGSVGVRQLLWVDALIGDEPADAHELLALLPFDGLAVEAMWASTSGPRLSVHGDYFLARVIALRPSKNRDENAVLDLVVGKKVVLTAHREPVAFLSEIDTRIRGDTTLGEIDSTDFATVLMDGLITSYLELTDAILAEVDALDGQALKPSGTRDLLADLVALRHRIAAVRRTLVAHRGVIAGMTGADFQVITGHDDAPRFVGLSDRFEGAVGAIDTAREALLGTFDISMSRTAQRTNEVMKALTIITVLLLPTVVIAGFMGMNIHPPYSNDDPAIFWFVVGGIALVAGLTLVALRVRRWL